MELTVSSEGNVNQVIMKGNFDIAASQQFDEKVSALIGEGAQNIILDFSEVPFVASTGLRMILKAAQGMKAKDGLLRLCCVNATVMEVFQMTGFDTILSIFDTFDAARDGMS